MMVFVVYFVLYVIYCVSSWKYDITGNFDLSSRKNIFKTGVMEALNGKRKQCSKMAESKR